jgi:RNA polymerase sigma-70 factor (ECF subfamily)
MKVSGSPDPKDGMRQLASGPLRRITLRGVIPADPAPAARLERRGGSADFRGFYDAWFEEVSRWARALGGIEADREDIVQEVFLVVRRRLGAFDGVNPAGWLYRITRRQVRDFRRRSWVKHIFTRRRFDEPDALPMNKDGDGDGGGPAAALEAKEKQRILYSILDKMHEDRRGAFVLFEIDGLSGEEIARIQSVPVNTVWTRLHHARKEFFALAAKFQARERNRHGADERGGGGR